MKRGEIGAFLQVENITILHAINLIAGCLDLPVLPLDDSQGPCTLPVLNKKCGNAQAALAPRHILHH